jgi:hypothetical protein
MGAAGALARANIRSYSGYAAEMGRERVAPLENRAIGTTASAASAVLARDRLLPLFAPLAGLFPEGGLRRGSVVVVGRGASPNPGQPDPGQPSTGQPSSGAPGLTSLALALLSGPSAGGSWCAVVGAPDIGLVAAGQLGIDLERLAVVPLPGPTWATVTAALLEGFDVVLLRAAGQVNYSDARKLEARARERGSVLAVMGDGWPGPVAVRLDIVAGRWCGLEDGCGHLWGREVEVVASGRGAASRPQRTRIWFGQPEFGAPEFGAPEFGAPEFGVVTKLELVTGDLVEVPATIGIAG